MLYKVNKNSTISVDRDGRRWLNGKSRIYHPDGTVDIIWGRVEEVGPNRYIAGETHSPDGTVKCWSGEYEERHHDEDELSTHDTVWTTAFSEQEAHALLAPGDIMLPEWE